MQPYDRNLKSASRRLRSTMTDGEQRLWLRLRRRQLLGVRFYRQKPLLSYIADFYAPAARLIVEVDGGQHFLHATIAADHRRTAVLEGLGLRVMRFDNRQVLLELDAVMEEIWRVVAERRA